MSQLNARDPEIADDTRQNRDAAALAQTAGIAASYHGAEICDRQGIIDTTEVSGNLGMAEVASQYLNNTPQSLAGFIAEQEFVRSFNLNAAKLGVSPAEASAGRLGSHELNSPDILTSWGETYQPKFYSTAEGSAGALTEIVADEHGLVNRYAGQMLLAPADQLEQVRDITQAKIDAALAAGETERAELLSDSLSRLTDHISHPSGASSDAFGYQEMQVRAEVAQAGGDIDLGNGFDVFDSSALLGEQMLLAAGLSAAVGGGAIVLSATQDLLSGKITSTELSTRLQEWWQSAGSSTAVEAGARSAAAGGLASLEGIDPLGAMLLVTTVSDITSLGVRASRGELRDGELGRKLKHLAGKWSIVTATGTVVAKLGMVVGGPLSVIGHFLVRDLIRDHKVQQVCREALNNIQDEMEKTTRSFVGSAIQNERAGALAEARLAASIRTADSAEDAASLVASSVSTARKLEGAFDSVLAELEAIRRGKSQ